LLLIYEKLDDDKLILARLGSHSELFGWIIVTDKRIALRSKENDDSYVFGSIDDLLQAG
jgi:hypothetical protein